MKYSNKHIILAIIITVIILLYLIINIYHLLGIYVYFTYNMEGVILYIDEIKEDFKIRKLTPRECFRLMGLNDSDIDKIQATGLSNSQQYKMAGNSIVVQVLEGIFKNLFIGEK